MVIEIKRNALSKCTIRQVYKSGEMDQINFYILVFIASFSLIMYRYSSQTIDFQTDLWCISYTARKWCCYFTWCQVIFYKDVAVSTIDEKISLWKIGKNDFEFFGNKYHYCYHYCYYFKERFYYSTHAKFLDNQAGNVLFLGKVSKAIWQ